MDDQPQTIVVAGGGPVGATAALSLASRGYRVTLVDRQRPLPGPSGLGMDVRNVALSPSSAGLLRTVNAWPDQAAGYDKMRVWEERGTSHLDFDAASVNRSELGWLVEVAPLLDRLWQQLDREPNVTVVLGSISGVQPGNDSVRIALADCESISEAAGLYLYLSGDVVERSDEADEQKKKAALFKAGVALSQLSVNHAEVYDVFCK